MAPSIVVSARLGSIKAAGNSFDVYKLFGFAASSARQTLSRTARSVFTSFQMISGAIRS
jgi:hypothetical protein